MERKNTEKGMKKEREKNILKINFHHCITFHIASMYVKTFIQKHSLSLL